MKKNIIKKLSLMSLLLVGACSITSCNKNNNNNNNESENEQQDEEETIIMTDSYEEAWQALTDFSNIEFPKLADVEVVGSDEEAEYLTRYIPYSEDVAGKINDYFNTKFNTTPEIYDGITYTDYYWSTESTIQDRKYHIYVGYYIYNGNIELYVSRSGYYLNKIVPTTGGSVVMTYENKTCENNQAYLTRGEDYYADATPDSGYVFDGFYANNKPLSLNPSARLTSHYDDIEIEARFVLGTMTSGYVETRAVLFRDYDVALPIISNLNSSWGEGVDSNTKHYFFTATLKGDACNSDNFNKIKLAFENSLGICDTGYPTGTDYTAEIDYKWTTRYYEYSLKWIPNTSNQISIRVDRK